MYVFFAYKGWVLSCSVRLLCSVGGFYLVGRLDAGASYWDGVGWEW